MDCIQVTVAVKRYSNTDTENTTNDQPENTFKVHASSLRSGVSDFMVAEETLQKISQLKAAITANIHALANTHVLVYYFDRNGDPVPMSNEAEFDIFLNTRIDQHIYVVQVPPSSSEFIVTTYDSEITFEFETNDHDAIFNTSTESDLSTETESDLSTETESDFSTETESDFSTDVEPDFEGFDAEEAYLLGLDHEEFNLVVYGNVQGHGVRAG